jgi:hypothetical protein
MDEGRAEASDDDDNNEIYLLLTSQTNYANLFVIKLGHELPREDVNDVGTRHCAERIIVVQHKERLNIHSENAALKVLALDR